MLKGIWHTLQKLITLLGFNLTRTAQHNEFSTKYATAVQDLERLYRELLFKDLPSENNNRITLLSKLLGTQFGEAMYILNFLHKSITLEGDICEFGIAQGSTSALLANEILHTKKQIWLFDSFKGLPKPTEKDLLIHDIFKLGSMEAYEGTMASGVESVTKRLKEIQYPFGRVNIVPGFIEKTIHNAKLPDKVSFAYIDFDFYEPILLTLNFLEKVLQPGGYIIVDDYDFFSSGAKTAVDEFLSVHENKYSFSLPIKAAGHFCIIQKKTT